jgi:carbon starvation protein
VRAVRDQRAGRPVVTSEAPFVESRLVAPSGLFPSAQERRELAEAAATSGGTSSGEGRR